MSEILDMVVDATTSIFRDHCSRDTLQGAERGEWPARLWNELEHAGVTTALVTEEKGGSGLGFNDVALIVRLAAYHAAPIPLAETIAAAWLLTDAGLDLPAGPLSIAPSSPGQLPTASKAGAGWRLEGACKRVPWGALATTVVVPFTTAQGDKLACIDPRQAEVHSGTNLAFEPRDTLRLSGVTLTHGAVFQWPREFGSPFMLGALLRVQQMAGAAQRALDLATEYAGERKQFGRPIARFQAIQQQLAAMAGHVAATNAAADSAASCWNTEKAEFAVAVAKARASEAAGQVAAIAHQVHGAMGFTREHVLHYSTRRLWAWRDEFGNETFWQQSLGKRVLELGADGLWQFLVRPPELHVDPPAQ